MATTFNVILLGVTATDIDPTEGNTTSDDMAALVGRSFGSGTDPLYGKVQTLAPVGSPGATYDTNNNPDQFAVNGTTYRFDGWGVYSATVTYVDGTTASVVAKIAQTTTGQLYLTPGIPGEEANQALLEAKPIQSLTLTAVGPQGTGMTADRLQGNFFEPVDGITGDDVMNVGYVDANGDAVTDIADLISGGNGNDQINAGGGNDTVYGGDGIDVIDDWGGNDLVYAGAGNDFAQVSTGNDTYYMDGGDDYVTVWDNAGTKLFHGGDGFDTLDLRNWQSTNGATVTLNPDGSGSFSHFNGATTGTFTGFEFIGGTAYADVVNASASTVGVSAAGEGGNDSLTGGSGDDVLMGDDGNDSLFGGFGDDYLEGSAGVDYALGGDGADWIFGGAGTDDLRGGAGDDSVAGGNDNDYIEGNDGSDTLSGDAGADNIRGNQGADAIYGGAGADYVDAGTEADTIYGGDDNDDLRGDAGNDLIHGDSGNDYVLGGEGDDAAYGGEGNDRLDGSSGADTLAGGSGLDTLNGGLGADLLGGDGGDDRLFGNEDADTLTGGAGNDTLDGGGGNDVAVFTGNVTDYRFDSGQSGEVFVTDLVEGRDGTDTLIGTEFVEFGGARFHLVNGTDGDNLNLQGPPDGTPSLIIAHDGADWGVGHATSDALFGGAGNDTLYGGDGDDTLVGEGDQDLLRGDAGRDQLYGGDGTDTLVGGAGDDLIATGAGNDIIVLQGDESTDRITDFDMTLTDGRTADQLDVSGMTNSDGSPVTARNVQVVGSNDDGSGDAVLVFDAGERVVLEGVSQQEASGKKNLAAMGIPCFVAGTPLLTPGGWKTVESLHTGDHVITTEGVQRVIWSGVRHLTADELAIYPALRPVHFPAGAVGNTKPLRVSPQHAILLRDTSGRKVFARAKHLAEIGFGRARVVRSREGVSYHHILLEKHAVVCAAGAPAESFYPGVQALAMLEPQSLRDLATAIFAIPGINRIGPTAALASAYGTRLHDLVCRSGVRDLSATPFGLAEPDFCARLSPCLAA